MGRIGIDNLQAFLGAAQTHMEGNHKTTVKRGLEFLVRNGRRTPQGSDLRGDGNEMICAVSLYAI